MGGSPSELAGFAGSDLSFFQARLVTDLHVRLAFHDTEGVDKSATGKHMRSAAFSSARAAESSDSSAVSSFQAADKEPGVSEGGLGIGEMGKDLCWASEWGWD